MKIAEQSANPIKTYHFKTTEPDAIDKTAALLKQGQLVVFPTDTLYGIGADAFDVAAIIKLYQAKGRPRDKGIPILLADISDLEKVTDGVPVVARTYIERFWPGPLTLVVPKSTWLPGIISPGNTVAVRIPDCKACRATIRAAGGAVATSSANRSGNPPARTAIEALAELNGWVAAVLDDGPSPHGTASTVLDCTVVPPKILREGPVTAAELALTNTL